MPTILTASSAEACGEGASRSCHFAAPRRLVCPDAAGVRGEVSAAVHGAGLPARRLVDAALAGENLPYVLAAN